MNKKRVLITGSHGFIGKHTTTTLLERGYLVHPIDRRFHHGGVTNVGDITDVGKMNQYFKQAKADYVIHLAANSSLQKSVTNAYHDAMNNIIGTIVILGMCQRYSIKKIVFASTTAVYADYAEMPLDEWSATAPMVPYGVSKLACENYIKASGVPSTILRYGNVYGPGQRPLGESILIARALAHIYQKQNFRINGDGTKTRDYVYVSDVVKANIKAMHHPSDDLFLIGTGRSYSVNEVCNTIKELTGMKGNFPHGLDKSGELQNVRFNTSHSASYLGWRPQMSLECGLELTIGAWPKE